MDIYKLILENCSEEEKALITPSLRVHDLPAALPEDNPFARCLQNAKENEDRHYERRVEAYLRHFGLADDDEDNIDFAEDMTGEGWWERRKCGAVPFQDVPQYRFRGQDLEISPVLVARDRAVEKKESLQKRQAAFRRVQRSMQRNWSGTLTRSLKSG